MTWYRLIRSASAVNIQIGEYVNQITALLTNMAEESMEEHRQLQGYSVDANTLVTSLQAIQYPYIQQIQQAVASKSPKVIGEEYYRLLKWNMDGGNKYYREIRDAMDILDNLRISLTSADKIYNTEMAKKDIANLSDAANRQMMMLGEKLLAITKMPGWNGSMVTIKPRDVSREDYYLPVMDAEVEVGVEGWAGMPSFTLFVNEDGSMYPEDVLEGGDKDFFSDDATQSDYFMMVRGLQGALNEKPKVLTLYTARPQRDRALYEKGQLPANIFLTDDLGFARGFGADYGEERDIWKVRVSSEFLLKTMDSPEQKQYQVIKACPAKMELLSVTTATKVA